MVVRMAKNAEPKPPDADDVADAGTVLALDPTDLRNLFRVHEDPRRKDVLDLILSHLSSLSKLAEMNSEDLRKQIDAVDQHWLDKGITAGKLATHNAHLTGQEARLLRERGTELLGSEYRQKAQLGAKMIRDAQTARELAYTQRRLAETILREDAIAYYGKWVPDNGACPLCGQGGAEDGAAESQAALPEAAREFMGA